ncbi:MAG: hypothetical protein ACLFV3_04950 [Phycisphaeraceae bacterium]
MREWLNKNSALVTVVAVVILVVALGVILLSGGENNPTAERESYYYDLNTGEIFTASAALDPPFETDAGGEGVSAAIFGCGECPEDLSGMTEADLKENNLYLLYLLRSPVEGEGVPPNEDMVRRPNMNEWIPAFTPPGEGVMYPGSIPCPGGRQEIVRCQPGGEGSR